MPSVTDVVVGAKELLGLLSKSRRKRDKSVNNRRTGPPEGGTSPGSHVPNSQRTRRDILDELT